MQVPGSLIAELEAAVQSGSREQRIEMLRSVTELFLASAECFNDQQIGLFDDVLLHLIKRIENKALAELSSRLAPVDSAPPGVVQSLARHDDIAVAAPMLSLSAVLTDSDLVEIAQTMGQGHLSAISGRTHLHETVTDVLVERGDREVVHKLARNPGAAFSQIGFSSLVARAETDESLAEKLGLRLDIPVGLLRKLLLKATEAVRTRLLALAPFEAREEIERVLASISNAVGREATAPRNFAQAQEFVLRLQQKSQLNEAAILEFAKTRKYEEMVAGLARICSAPLGLIERIVQNVRYDGLLVVCKAVELKWPTVIAILTNRFAHHSIAPSELEQAKTDFLRLKQVTAQRVLRFWLIRETSTSTPGSNGAALEERLSPRDLTLKTAKIVSDKTTTAIDCAILDVSAAGACVLVTDIAAVPDKFELVIDPDGAKRNCNVAWRSGKRIGLSWSAP